MVRLASIEHPIKGTAKKANVRKKAYVLLTLVSPTSLLSRPGKTLATLVPVPVSPNNQWRNHLRHGQELLVADAPRVGSGHVLAGMPHDRVHSDLVAALAADDLEDVRQERRNWAGRSTSIEPNSLAVSLLTGSSYVVLRTPTDLREEIDCTAAPQGRESP
jgi:hypothetical protein